MAIFAMFAALALSAATDTPVDDDRCLDPAGRDRCPAEIRSYVQAHFDLPAAEDLVGRGATLRLFTIDGYGEAKAAMIFRNLAWREPRAEVHFPSDTKWGGLAPFTTSVTGADLRAVRKLAVLVKRSPVDAPPVPNERIDENGQVEFVVCAHGWTYLAELIERGQVTRRARSACDDEALGQDISEMPSRILARLPHCRWLDRRNYRGELSVIEACRTLRGDLASASEIRNIIDSRLYGFRSAETDIRPTIGEATVVTTAGARLEPAKVVQFWSAKAWHPNFTRISARAGKAQSTGFAWRGGDEVTEQDKAAGIYDRTYEAPLTAIWQKAGGRWLVTAISVGDFRLARVWRDRKGEDRAP